MNCENAVGLFIDSLMDELDQEQQTGLAAHLETCESCRAEVEEIDRTWNELGELPLPKRSPQAKAKLGRRLYSGRPPGWPSILSAAAAIALFLIGSTAGYLVRGSTSQQSGLAAGRSAYLLLVRGELPGVIEGEDVVGEYAAWAQSLAAAGRLVGANKLTDEPGRWVSRPEARETRTRSDVSGYFLVGASTYEEVVQLAQSSPHVQYGGTFEIREVDPVARTGDVAR